MADLSPISQILRLVFEANLSGLGPVGTALSQLKTEAQALDQPLTQSAQRLTALDQAAATAGAQARTAGAGLAVIGTAAAEAEAQARPLAAGLGQIAQQSGLVDSQGRPVASTLRAVAEAEAQTTQQSHTLAAGMQQAGAATLTAGEEASRSTGFWNGLRGGLTSTQESAKGLSGGLQGLLGALGPLAGPIAGLTASMTAALGMKEALTATEHLGAAIFDMQQKMGLTAEDASKLHFALQETTGNADGAQLALTRFAKAVAGVDDAESGLAFGSGKALQANIKELGIQLDDSAGKARPMSEILLDLSDKFKQMGPGAQSTALAMQLFGRSGADMLPFLLQGREGIARLGEEAQKLGVVLDQGTIAKTRELTLAQREAKAAFEGIAITIGTATLPAVLAITQGTAGVVTQFGERLGPVLRDAFSLFGQIGGAVQGVLGPFEGFLGQAAIAVTVGAGLVLGLNGAVAAFGAAKAAAIGMAEALKIVEAVETEEGAALAVANPLLLGIGVAIAGAILLWEHFSGSEDKAKASTDAVNTSLKALRDSGLSYADIVQTSTQRLDELNAHLADLKKQSQDILASVHWEGSVAKVIPEYQSLQQEIKSTNQDIANEQKLHDDAATSVKNDASAHDEASRATKQLGSASTETQATIQRLNDEVERSKSAFDSANRELENRKFILDSTAKGTQENTAAQKAFDEQQAAVAPLKARYDLLNNQATAWDKTAQEMQKAGKSQADINAAMDVFAGKVRFPDDLAAAWQRAQSAQQAALIPSASGPYAAWIVGLVQQVSGTAGLVGAWQQAEAARQHYLTAPTGEQLQNEAQLKLYQAEATSLQLLSDSHKANNDQLTRLNELTKVLIPSQQEWNKNTDDSVNAIRSLVEANKQGALSDEDLHTKLGELEQAYGGKLPDYVQEYIHLAEDEADKAKAVKDAHDQQAQAAQAAAAQSVAAATATGTAWQGADSASTVAIDDIQGSIVSVGGSGQQAAVTIAASVDDIQGSLVLVGTSAQTTATTVAGATTSIGTSFGGLIKAAVDSVAKSAAPLQTFETDAKTTFTNVATAAQTMATGVVTEIATTWGPLSDTLLAPWREAERQLGSTADSGTLFGQLYGGVSGYITSTQSLLTSTGPSIQQGLTAPFADAVGTITGTLTILENNLAASLGRMQASLAGFQQGVQTAVSYVEGQLVGGGSGGTTAAPPPQTTPIAGAAAGGAAGTAPGWWLVGERGPELVKLPRGAVVVPAQPSAALMALGIGALRWPHVLGGLAGGTPGWVDSTLAAVGDLTPGSDQAQHLADVVGQGGPALASAAWAAAGNPSFTGAGALAGPAQQFTSSVQQGFTTAVSGLLDRLAPKVTAAMAAVSAIAVNLPGAVSDWLEQAAQLALGRSLSGAELSAMLALVAQESGGDPNAYNPTPVGGDHAQGLLQTLSGTFAANAVPGHGNILNPVDNAAAAMRYILAVYGDLTVPAAREAAGAPGYARGGVALGDVLAVVGEAGPELVFAADGYNYAQADVQAALQQHFQQAASGIGTTVSTTITSTSLAGAVPAANTAADAQATAQAAVKADPAKAARDAALKAEIERLAAQIPPTLAGALASAGVSDPSVYRLVVALIDRARDPARNGGTELGATVADAFTTAVSATGKVPSAGFLRSLAGLVEELGPAAGAQLSQLVAGWGDQLGGSVSDGLLKALQTSLGSLAGDNSQIPGLLTSVINGAIQRTGQEPQASTVAALGTLFQRVFAAASPDIASAVGDQLAASLGGTAATVSGALGALVTAQAGTPPSAGGFIGGAALSGVGPSGLGGDRGTYDSALGQIADAATAAAQAAGSAADAVERATRAAAAAGGVTVPQYSPGLGQSQGYSPTAYVRPEGQDQTPPTLAPQDLSGQGRAYTQMILHGQGAFLMQTMHDPSSQQRLAALADAEGAAFGLPAGWWSHGIPGTFGGGFGGRTEDQALASAQPAAGGATGWQAGLANIRHLQEHPELWLAANPNVDIGIGGPHGDPTATLLKGFGDLANQAKRYGINVPMPPDLIKGNVQEMVAQFGPNVLDPFWFFGQPGQYVRGAGPGTPGAMPAGAGMGAPAAGPPVAGIGVGIGQQVLSYLGGTTSTGGALGPGGLPSDAMLKVIGDIVVQAEAVIPENAAVIAKDFLDVLGQSFQKTGAELPPKVAAVVGQAMIRAQAVSMDGGKQTGDAFLAAFAQWTEATGQQVPEALARAVSRDLLDPSGKLRATGADAAKATVGALVDVYNQSGEVPSDKFIAVLDHLEHAAAARGEEAGTSIGNMIMYDLRDAITAQGGIPSEAFLQAVGSLMLRATDAAEGGSVRLGNLISGTLATVITETGQVPSDALVNVIGDAILRAHQQSGTAGQQIAGFLTKTIAEWVNRTGDLPSDALAKTWAAAFAAAQHVSVEQAPGLVSGAMALIQETFDQSGQVLDAAAASAIVRGQAALQSVVSGHSTELGLLFISTLRDVIQDGAGPPSAAAVATIQSVLAAAGNTLRGGSAELARQTAQAITYSLVAGLGQLSDTATTALGQLMLTLNDQAHQGGQQVVAGFSDAIERYETLSGGPLSDSLSKTLGDVVAKAQAAGVTDMQRLGALLMQTLGLAVSYNGDIPQQALDSLLGSLTTGAAGATHDLLLKIAAGAPPSAEEVAAKASADFWSKQPSGQRPPGLQSDAAVDVLMKALNLSGELQRQALVTELRAQNLTASDVLTRAQAAEQQQTRKSIHDDVQLLVAKPALDAKTQTAVDQGTEALKGVVLHTSGTETHTAATATNTAPLPTAAAGITSIDKTAGQQLVSQQAGTGLLAYIAHDTGESKDTLKGILGALGGPSTPVSLPGTDKQAAKAFALGGLLTEPVYGLGLQTGQRYSFAERGPEWIGPRGGPEQNVTNQYTFQPGSVTIPAKDVQEFRDVTQFFQAFEQVARAKAGR